MSKEYYQTKESVNEYVKAAEGHSGKALIAKLKPHLLVQSTVLELGTGPGTDWEILSKNYEVTGSDFSEAFLSRLKAQYPNGRFINLNAATLAINESFDCIYSNKVLHHLTDARLANSIKRQAEMVNDKGIICHSFWEGKGSAEFNGMFVNYHTEEELQMLFEKDFDILLLEKYKEFEDGDSLLLIARKK
jgi:2-polyprenyl-3-methyl-5-hydroxy-6-metoxy-1,4-benzoquinol methylase